MLKTAEAVVFAIITAALLGLAAWGQHHKRAADELQDELVRARLREQTCADAVAQLDAEAKEREAAAAQALAAAQSAADRHAQRADKLLRQPAAVPGDDCASARVRARKWLEARR